MTYAELRLALQLIAEEQVGSPARRAVMAAKAREDAAAEASKQAAGTGP